jgi:uncharacterized protein
MLKDVLKSIILAQQEWLHIPEREVEREMLEDLKELHPFAYIITGMRRSGKSTLMKQCMRMHRSRNYLNLEDSRTADFEVVDFLVAEQLFGELFGDSKILFFDEIQVVPGWERYVRDAVDRGKTVVITGSKAKMLSNELGTKLTGRHLDFELFPFSYTEYLAFHNQSPGLESFQGYLTEGGFPGFLAVKNRELLTTLASDILMRDIYARYNLRNQEVYRRMMQFLLTNNGKEMSFNNLRKVFEIGSANTVMDFLQFLTDAYLFFLVPMYHTSLKVQIRNPKKVYGIDQGLVFSTSSSGSPDRGRLLETTVFLHLKRTGAEVWYFKGKKECDFITRTGKTDYHAFQVCLDVNEQNQHREFSGLLEAMEELKLQHGTILTMNQSDTVLVERKVIHLIPTWKWLSTYTS